MSIIYEALKKVEKTQTPDVKEIMVTKKKSETKIHTYLLFGLIVAFGFFIANIIFGVLTKPQVAKIKTIPVAEVKKQPVVVVKKVALVNDAPLKIIAEVKKEILPPQITQKPPELNNDYIPPLVLSGLFFSDNQGYALINNQILKEGDEIDGAKVKSITLEEVQLEANGSIITLANSK